MDEIELLDTSSSGNASVATDELKRRGLTRWLALIPIASIVLAVFVVGAGESDEAEPPPTTELEPSPVEDSVPDEFEEGVGFGERRIRGNEAERLGLIHGDQPYRRSVGAEGDYVIALRSGSDLVVIDSTKELAHRIQLPLSSANDEVRDFTMAVVADKLVVADGDLLRSLSVQGGVDLLLANDLVGFQVYQGQVIVAAEPADGGFRSDQRTELRVQGVHGDSFGVLGDSAVPDGARIVTTGGQVLVELGGAVFVPTAQGLEPLHPGSVIAAGPNHVFIRNCATVGEVRCPAIQVSSDGSEAELVADPPFLAESNYVVSPSGDAVFVIDELAGVQGLFELDDSGVWGEMLEFGSGEVSAAQFTPDGSLLVTVSGGRIEFWNGQTMVGSWAIDGLGEISEIAVAQ